VHGWVEPDSTEPPLVNVPNLITLLRTVVAVPLAMAAVVEHSAVLAVSAYLCYWVGDILDGLVARRLHQETRTGAVFDILADRASAAACVAALLVLRPAMAIPLSIFLIEFMVLDCLLTLAFLRWPLLSPNYFDLVHRGIYRWNWWPPAKVLNSGVLTVLVVLSPSALYPTVFVLLVTAIKVCSLVTVGRLEPGPSLRERPRRPRL
jgi:CDP-diacylglycerol--glycerol-3-phosphate 3-phosphatidyltransferase